MVVVSAYLRNNCQMSKKNYYGLRITNKTAVRFYMFVGNGTNGVRFDKYYFHAQKNVKNYSGKKNIFFSKLKKIRAVFMSGY